MILGQLNMPTHDNDGKELGELHKAIQTDLCQHFGGFTMSEQTGGWTDNNGKLYVERVNVYQVALEDLKAGEKLKLIGYFHGFKARQLAVYTVIDGVPLIKDLNEAAHDYTPEKVSATLHILPTHGERVEARRIANGVA